MKVADAHCDTLTAFDGQLNNESACWNLNKFKEVNGCLQYLAIFTDPQYSGDSAMRYAVKHLGKFWQLRDENTNLLLKSSDYDENKVNFLLSLEGASPVIDEISNLYAYHRLGVRSIVLTWNHRNFVGDGVDSHYGLTDFGKDFVREMEKLCMLVDVSHLNVNGFDDVVSVANKPFMASHSNAYAVHPHRRNLNDDQIKEIIARGGFIGINFYSLFLGEGEDNEQLIMKFIQHIEHFLKIGAENVLGFGADWDGMEKSPFSDVRDYHFVEKLFREQLTLSEEQINKIMYKNLVDYTLKILE